jgi:hypothetical protein
MELGLMADRRPAARASFAWPAAQILPASLIRSVSLVGSASLIVSVSAAIFWSAAARADPRAVVELFTSQGCSSCPPADKLLGELTRDSSIVAISLPVDYWDYLGWKDTLALPGHSKRQHAYARARGDREVYTPQVVVNGAIHVLGSDKAAIERAIAQSESAGHTGLALPISVTVADNTLTVNVATGKSQPGNGEVWLCPLTKSVPVAIGRGENNGRTITYYNVVRRWIKLGDWKGKADTFRLPVADITSSENVDAVAVIVQGGVASAPGLMLGAAVTSLR